MKYPVIETLKHNNQVYKPGDIVDLNQEEAKRLLNMKVIDQSISVKKSKEIK